MSTERTGIVEESRERRERYARFIAHQPPGTTPAAKSVAPIVILRARIADLERALAGKDREIARQATQLAELLDWQQLAIRGTLPAERLPLPTAEAVLAIAAEVIGKPVVELMGRRRYPRLALERQFAYWLIHVVRPDMAANQIGVVIDKDRSTVKSGIRRVERDKDREPFATWRKHPQAAALIGRRGTA